MDFTRLSSLIVSEFSISAKKDGIRTVLNGKEMHFGQWNCTVNSVWSCDLEFCLSWCSIMPTTLGDWVQPDSRSCHSSQQPHSAAAGPPRQVWLLPPPRQSPAEGSTTWASAQSSLLEPHLCNTTYVEAPESHWDSMQEKIQGGKP